MPTSTGSHNNQPVNSTVSPFNNANSKKQAKTPQDTVGGEVGK